MKKIFVYISLMLFSNSYSQYTLQWADRLNGTANSFDIAGNMFLDEQSNAYVYSTMSNTGSLTDICAVKYSPNGAVLWRYVYSSPGIDQLQDVYKDSKNFSYIAAYTQDSGQIKLLTIKLSPAGDTMWTRITSVPNHENLISRSIIPDNLNNICVLLDGRNLTTSKTDFIIIKFNQQGNIIGQKIQEGSPDGDDNGIKLICDAQGNFFAGVNSFYTGTGFDLAVYKFDNNLNGIYVKRMNGTANSDDGIVDMKLSSDNNLLLTAKVGNAGSSSDIGTFKINNINEDILWEQIYNGAGNNIDLPYALTTDNLNNILVTGYARNGTANGSEDIITLKYNSAGNLLWSRVYNDSVNGIDQGYSVCADNENNVYIGAATDHGNGHLGYLTLKYDAAGNLFSKNQYHYYNLSEDFIYKVAVNKNQDIFVSGISFSNTTDYDVTTIKYAYQTGIYSEPEIVSDFKLYQSYPNPFNPSAKVKFYNPKRDFITLRIYDLRGREIKTLVNDFLNEGFYEYEFNAENLSSGIYFYKVFYDDKFQSGKMILGK